MYVHYIYVHCWERLWHGCQKIIFIQNQVWPRRPSVSLHPPPPHQDWDCTSAILFENHGCCTNLHKKSIFAHCKSTVCMFSTIQRSFRGKASYQNDSSNTFFIHSVPNQTQLYRFVRSECCWSVGVSDLAYRFTLCTLVPRTHTFPTGSRLNKRINFIAIYCETQLQVSISWVALYSAPGKNRPPPSAFRLAENGKKRPIHGKSAQGVTEP